MTHGASEIASWGATSLNPDISDLYVEQIKDGKYLSKDKTTWEDIEESTETLKVRFSDDVELKIRHTRNGVLLPMSFLDGGASSL
jgi:penicillin amidase